MQKFVNIYCIAILTMSVAYPHRVCTHPVWNMGLVGAVVTDSQARSPKPIKPRKLDGTDILIHHSTNPQQPYQDARAEWCIKVPIEKLDTDFSDIEYAKRKTEAVGIPLGDPPACGFGHRPVYWLILVENPALKEAIEKEPEKHQGKQWQLALGPIDIWRHGFLTKAQVQIKINAYLAYLKGENNLSVHQQHMWKMLRKYQEFLSERAEDEQIKLHDLIDARRTFTDQDYQALEHFYQILVQKIPGLGYFAHTFEACLTRLWEHKDEDNLFDARQRVFLSACEEVINVDVVELEGFRALQEQFGASVWSALFNLYFNIPPMADPTAPLNIEELKGLMDQISKAHKALSHGDPSLWNNVELIRLYTQYFAQLPDATVALALWAKFHSLLPQLFPKSQEQPFHIAIVFSKAAKVLEYIHQKLFGLFFQAGSDPYTWITHLCEVSCASRLEAETILHRLSLTKEHISFSLQESIWQGIATQQFHWLYCPEWPDAEWLIQGIPAPIVLLHTLAQRLVLNGVMMVSSHTQMSTQKQGDLFTNPLLYSVMEKYFGIWRLTSGNLHELIDLEHQVEMDDAQQAIIQGQLENSSYLCGVKVKQAPISLVHIGQSPEIMNEIMNALSPIEHITSVRKPKTRSQKTFLPALSEQPFADLRAISYERLSAATIGSEKVPPRLGVNIDTARLAIYAEQLLYVDALQGLTPAELSCITGIVKAVSAKQEISQTLLKEFMEIYQRFADQARSYTLGDITKHFEPVLSLESVKESVRAKRLQPNVSWDWIWQKPQYSFEEFVQAVRILIEVTQPRIQELPVEEQVQWAMVSGMSPEAWRVSHLTERITPWQHKKMVRDFAYTFDLPAKDYLRELGVELMTYPSMILPILQRSFAYVGAHREEWNAFVSGQMDASHAETFMTNCFGKRDSAYALLFLSLHAYYPWLPQCIRYLRTGNIAEGIIRSCVDKLNTGKDRWALLLQRNSSFEDRILFMHDIFGNFLRRASGYTQIVEQNENLRQAFQKWIGWWVMDVLQIPWPSFIAYYNNVHTSAIVAPYPSTIPSGHTLQATMMVTVLPSFPPWWPKVEKNVREDKTVSPEQARNFTKAFYMRHEEWQALEGKTDLWWRKRDFLWSVFGKIMCVASGYAQVQQGRQSYEEWRTWFTREVLTMKNTYAQTELASLEKLSAQIRASHVSHIRDLPRGSVSAEILARQYAQQKIAYILLGVYPYTWWALVEKNLEHAQLPRERIETIREQFRARMPSCFEENLSRTAIREQEGEQFLSKFPTILFSWCTQQFAQMNIDEGVSRDLLEAVNSSFQEIFMRSWSGPLFSVKIFIDHFSVFIEHIIQSFDEVLRQYQISEEERIYFRNSILFRLKQGSDLLCAETGFSRQRNAQLRAVIRNKPFGWEELDLKEKSLFLESLFGETLPIALGYTRVATDARQTGQWLGTILSLVFLTTPSEWSGAYHITPGVLEKWIAGTQIPALEIQQQIMRTILGDRVSVHQALLGAKSIVCAA